MHRWVASGRWIGAVVSASAPTCGLRCVPKGGIHWRTLRMTRLSLNGHARRYSRWFCCNRRNSGLSVSLRNHKVPNGKLKVTVGKRLPILNSRLPALLNDCSTISQALATCSIRRPRNSCSSRSCTVYLPKLTNHQKPRPLTWAQEFLRMLLEGRAGIWLFW
jgi:hypothetical protein